MDNRSAAIGGHSTDSGSQSSQSTEYLHVVSQGTGMPVVLSHALGLDLTMWDDYATRLASRASAQGCEVLRYDHRGHGQSTVLPGPYSMHDLVDDAARLIRQWNRGPVTWVGLSMGAMVGQGLAIRYPDLVSRLVLANTTSRYPQAAVAAWMQRIEIVRAKGMAAVADMIVERYLHADFRSTRPEIADAIRQRLLRDDPEGYAASCFAVAHVDWADRLSEIWQPTLVISGALDGGAPPAMGQAIAERIPGSEMAVFKNASHLSVIETPHLFGDAIDGFLARFRT